MSSAYPHFNPSYTHEELVEHFLLTPADLQLVWTCRGEANQCGMALLLKALTYLGYVPDNLDQLTGEASESLYRPQIIAGGPGTSSRGQNLSLLNSGLRDPPLGGDLKTLTANTALQFGTGTFSRSPSRTMKPVNSSISVGAPRPISSAMEPTCGRAGSPRRESCRRIPLAERRRCRPVLARPLCIRPPCRRSGAASRVSYNGMRCRPSLVRPANHDAIEHEFGPDRAHWIGDDLGFHATFVEQFGKRAHTFQRYRARGQATSCPRSNFQRSPAQHSGRHSW